MGPDTSDTYARHDGDAAAAGGSQRSRHCVQAGEMRAALQAASDACHAAPQLPQPHYAYGEAWRALGDSQRAGRAFGEAVRLAPTWPDAWINLGLALYQQGRI